jgi:hypothetical protein
MLVISLYRRTDKNEYPGRMWKIVDYFKVGLLPGEGEEHHEKLRIADLQGYNRTRNQSNRNVSS